MITKIKLHSQPNLVFHLPSLLNCKVNAGAEEPVIGANLRPYLYSARRSEEKDISQS